MKYTKLVVLFIVLILAIAGCRGPDTSSETDTKGSSPSTKSGIEGCWQGTWKSTKDGTSGNFQVEFEKSGSSLDGKVVITGSAVTRGGDISGTYAGNVINFGFVAGPGADVKYTGKVNGNSMSGDWTVAAVNDKGTWEGTKGCGELEGLTGTAVDIANNGFEPTSGSNEANNGVSGSTSGSGEAYDLNSGVSCSQSGPGGSIMQTYSFKGESMRLDGPQVVPGVISYDLQYANDAYYKLVINGAQCQAIKTKVTTPIEEWRKKTIDNWVDIRSKLSPPYPVGTPVCEGNALDTALFEIPAGCQIVG